jgi:transcription termination factor Rho
MAWQPASVQFNRRVTTPAAFACTCHRPFAPCAFTCAYSERCPARGAPHIQLLPIGEVMTTITTETTALKTVSKPRGSAPASHGVPAKHSAPARDSTTAKPEPTAAVSGLADLADSRGHLRLAGYRRGGDDVPLTAAQVRQYGLRPGDQVDALVTTGGRAGRSLADVTAVNGLPPEAAAGRRRFDELTPVYPRERLRLEAGDPSRTARIIDLIAPIGKGTRGLIVAPPKTGKTTVLKTIANAIAAGYPEVHLMMVLVGERPEEVTELQRGVRAEVIASTFDASPGEHVKAAELAIERAKRLAEAGRDVVVLLDSLTRLGRAYNLVAPAGGRTLSGGVAAVALAPPRRFLGAARCLEEGGSVTILSTALVDTGSQLDSVLFEEFKGTGNMELRLSRDLAEKRLFPAVDAVPSGTRREELLMDPAEHAAVVTLRRALAALDTRHALELLLDKTREPNEKLLRQISASAN